MNISTRIELMPGREKRVQAFHPWVQKEDIRLVDGVDEAGIARLYTHDGQFLGMGAYNPASRFAFRVYTHDDREIDEEFFRERIRASLAKRRKMGVQTDSVRAIFSESDGIPGLIVDVYGANANVLPKGGHAVMQVRSLVLEQLRAVWLPILEEELGAASLYERSDMAGRLEEGLGQASGQISGKTPSEIWIEENGLKLLALPIDGLKTGFYLDQRQARLRLMQQIQPGQKVLDAFSYTGGFAVAAAQAGAEVVAVDSFAPAVDGAERTLEKNGLKGKVIQANTFEFLERGADDHGPFDWIILDPPAISKTRQSKSSLKWAVWKLVYMSLPLLKPGGHIVACSCSFQLGLTELMDTCRLAASDQGCDFSLEEITLQDTDHPVSLGFPQSLYLKSIWLRRD